MQTAVCAIHFCFGVWNAIWQTKRPKRPLAMESLMVGLAPLLHGQSHQCSRGKWAIGQVPPRPLACGWPPVVSDPNLFLHFLAIEIFINFQVFIHGIYHHYLSDLETLSPHEDLLLAPAFQILGGNGGPVPQAGAGGWVPEWGVILREWIEMYMHGTWLVIKVTALSKPLSIFISGPCRISWTPTSPRTSTPSGKPSTCFHWGMMFLPIALQLFLWFEIAWFGDAQDYPLWI